ncbi:MAG: 30S ribosome-binding factor RbfA [Thermoflexales bacterium]|jgi:ribosome-binding factor A|nr:30S ribosome-binding factor RbfA [Thermoflexales bacterium]
MSKKYEGRISELVRARLTVLLESRVNDPRIAGITVTDVEVTADTRYARVYYSLIGDDEAKALAQRGLDSASGFLRHELGQTLRTKRTPELTFIHDESLERGERMAHLLDIVREQDAKKPE